MIPPEADAECVANMQEVLTKFENAYDYECPVVYIYETPVRLVGEMRKPIPATKEYPERIEYEYERKGTASIFVCAEPMSGFREVTSRPQLTRIDWGHENYHLLDTRYDKTSQAITVCDNLNTHTKWAVYETFPANTGYEYARSISVSCAPNTVAGST